MKKKVIGLVVFGVIILSPIVFYFVSPSLTENKTTNIEVYNIAESEKVFINGVIEPQEKEDIYLDATKGNVNTISVKDGQMVKKDDVLFTYKNDQVTEQIKQINIQLESSKNQKKELLAQQESLKTQPVATGETLTPTTVSTSSIDSQIKLYEEQINSLKEKEYSTIVAPIEGKVIIHDVTKDGNTPYITIENTNFYIKGTVSEKEQSKLKVGQLTENTILSTNNIVKGKITSIGNKPISETMKISNAASTVTPDISYYEVKINLDNQENLTNGFHVQSIVKLTDESVKIPKSSILQDGETYYVYKIINKRLAKQVITYSEGNSEEVIVNTGLKEREEIVKNPTLDMKEGISIE